MIKIIPQIGIENIVLETDGPYLAPEPFRGKRNEPAYLEFVALKLCDIFNLSLSEIADHTTQNAHAVFANLIDTNNANTTS